jgi:hypothetical protein
MTDQIEEKISKLITDDADGWEWMLVEIMGHRTHWGRARQEERFGAKMLRIDVPIIELGAPDLTMATATMDGTIGQVSPAKVTGWTSHFYGGPAIFSFTLTDEATVMARNKPYERPARYTLPPPETIEHDDDGFDDGGPYNEGEQS